MFTQLIHRVAICLAPAVLLLGGGAAAQTLVQQGSVRQSPSPPFTPTTNLSGNVFDNGGGGPLLAGRTYHVTSNITVPAGETLTIRRGAVLKFVNGAIFNVSGRLDVRGRAGRKVRFTSYLDDALGGDTFNDGPTVGAPGNWGGIVSQVGGSIDMKFADMRFCGSGGWRAIYGQGGDISLRNSRFRDSLGPGIDLNNYDVPTVIENCSMQNNTGWAIDEAKIERVPSFLNNTASGNTLGDAIRAGAGNLVADTTIVPANLIEGALVINGASTIPAGVTLTLEAGVGIKFVEFSGGQFIADGTFVTNGTAAEPVIITSLLDDDYFGDTENDGSTAGAASNIRGVYARIGGHIDMEHTLVRFGGSGGFYGIYGGGGSIALESCTIRDGTGPGIDLNNYDVPTVITNCVIENNTGWAIDDAKIERVPFFQNNTASNNTLGDAIRAGAGNLVADTTIVPANLIEGALVINGASTIPAGVTLTLEAGVGIKFVEFSGGQFIADGTFVTNGTAAEPVIITSLLDDDYFGDTENDGSTAGAASDIRGVYTRIGGHIDMEHTLVRYGGSGGFHGVYCGGGTMSLVSCTIRDGSGPGIDINNYDVSTAIVDCDIENNSGVAVDDARIERLPGLDSNRAQGNAGGDYIRMGGQSTTGDAVVGPRNLINGALVATSTTITEGDTVTLLPGTVIKFVAGLFVVSGNLRIEGTGLEPVVLTSFADDDHAGDTNGDGPSSGSPGGWSGVDIRNTSVSSSLEHALVRYSGSGGWDGIRCTTGGLTTFDSLRVEHSQYVGFRLTGLSVAATNLVAYENGGFGIRLETGFFDLVHATVSRNGGVGINAVTNYAGKVRNTNSWGQQPNYLGLTAGEMFNSNGDFFLDGADGNINLDPLFVDMFGGDLRLGPGSPAADTADFTVAASLVMDHSDNSRLVRTLASGSLEADMGAYERVLWTMDGTGTPAIGETLTLQVNGQAGTVSYSCGSLDGTLLIDPVGFLLVGVASAKPLASAIAVGSPLLVPIPDDVNLVGTSLGFQGLVTDSIDPSISHFTNLMRVVVQPALP